MFYSLFKIKCFSSGSINFHMRLINSKVLYKMCSIDNTRTRSKSDSSFNTCLIQNLTCYSTHISIFKISCESCLTLAGNAKNVKMIKFFFLQNQFHLLYYWARTVSLKSLTYLDPEISIQAPVSEPDSPTQSPVPHPNSWQSIVRIQPDLYQFIHSSLLSHLLSHQPFFLLSFAENLIQY